jgi:hypothetical protein
MGKQEDGEVKCFNVSIYSQIQLKSVISGN